MAQLALAGTVTLTTPPPEARITHCRGFSLIELLCVLTCIAILTSVALPTYDTWRQRSQRAQARLALMQMAQWLERSAAANGRYPAASDIPPNLSQIAGLRYRLNAQMSEQSFVLLATPMNAQASDACATLTLDHLGQGGVMGATLTANACWQR